MDSAPFRRCLRGLKGGAARRESQLPGKTAGQFLRDADSTMPRGPQFRVPNGFPKWKAGPEGTTGSPGPWRRHCGQNRVSAGDPSLRPGAPGSAGRSQPLSAREESRACTAAGGSARGERESPQLSITGHSLFPRLPAWGLLRGAWIPGPSFSQGLTHTVIYFSCNLLTLLIPQHDTVSERLK